MGSIERGASSYLDLRDVRQGQEQSARAARVEGIPPAHIERGAAAEVR